MNEATDNALAHETWLGQLTEDIIEPNLAIVDPHHHLWVREGGPYLLPELLTDLYSGHNVTSTVFAECHSMYRPFGDVALRPVGETEFVAGVAAMSESGNFGSSRACAVMFGGADLTLGAAVERVLDAHVQAAGGRFRGVRFSTGWHAHEKIRNVAPHESMLRDPRVREGLGVLQRMGLAFDSWLYHPQLEEVAEIAAAFPDLTIVLNHVGSPILGGPYRGKTDDVFSAWKTGIATVAPHANVVMKLGALPIRMPGSSADRSQPPGSEEVANAWRPWIEHCIESFGPSRCMFESNFPVQRAWCSYQVVWNAFKRLATSASADEKADLFSGTATRAYRIEPLPT
ncbi:MAG: L-fuconolactonase [Gammaproteobacteria bacterium]|jgi:L-fuconolactonase